MTEIGALQAAILEVGTAGMACAAPGDGLESGDLHVVVPFAAGALVAVIDGLGHGSEAAAAARVAAAALVRHAALPVLQLIELCHTELRRTRGAVMSLVQFSAADSSVTWAGVGNVEGILLRGADRERGREAIPMRAGVVGYRLPPLREQRVPLSPGDTLVMATDGVRSGFASDLALDRTPQALADSILARDGKQSDDALVLVARYMGWRP